MVVNLPNECKKYSGADICTTNNRMELIAVIQALKQIDKVKTNDVQFEIYSDSAYVINAINNRWLWNWERDYWKIKTGDPVKNVDLWQSAAGYISNIQESGKKLKFFKVKGHSGNTFNELCDQLAKKEVERIQPYSWG